MDDLVGSDFDVRFLDWLFDSAQTITAPPAADPPAESRSPPPPAPAAARQASGGGRLLSNALAASSNQQPEKRKFDDRQDQQSAGGNKRRIPEGLPSGPRAMSGEGRSLADRMGPRGGPGGRGGFHVRGMAGGRGGFGGGFQHHGQGQGFRPGPGMIQPGFNGFLPPGQQEMMAQMMMMQANMAQMSEMMQKMAEVCPPFPLSLLSPSTKSILMKTGARGGPSSSGRNTRTCSTCPTCPTCTGKDTPWNEIRQSLGLCRCPQTILFPWAHPRQTLFESALSILGRMLQLQMPVLASKPRGGREDGDGVERGSL
jgi:hypothetical protein